MMTMIFTLLLAISSPISFAKGPAEAVSFQVIPEKSAVRFLAVGRPSMLKIHGTSTEGPKGSLKLEGAKLLGEILVSVSKLDTGIALRTEHMKEKYLEEKKYPEAKLTVLEAGVEPAFSTTISTKEAPFRGKLALHGKEKEVSGTFQAENGKLSAKFPVNLTDFAIEVPKYLGVTVAEQVDVDVDLGLQK